MSSDTVDRKIAVILATDVVGYSRHMETNEKETIHNLKACEQILTKTFKKHKGRLFNTGGDSFLIEFPSAVEAVECAVSFQEQIKKRNTSDNPTIPLEFRIGINTGDVIQDKDNLLGDGVNIAARLESLAQTNGITISKAVYDFIKGKTDFRYNDLGIQKVKKNEFHAYDILLDPSQKRKLKTQKSNRPVLAIVASFLVIAVVSFLFINSSEKQSDEILETKNTKVSDKPILLIKPFKLLAKDTGYDYIASGFTGYLNKTLSKIARIQVLPGSTASHITKNNFTNDQIRKEYNVDFVLESDIQISGETIRISSKLSNILKKSVVASETYELTDEKIFEYQDKIAELVLQKMSIRDAPIGRRISENPEIYKKHLIAYGHFITWTSEGHYKAEEIWNEITKKEPENHSLSQMIGWLLQQKVALGLSSDPISDYEKGLEIALKNIKNHPNSIDPLTLASTMEGYLGRYKEACSRLILMDELLSKKMNETIHVAMVSYIHQNCEQHQRAITLYEHVFRQSPYFPAWVKYYYVYALLASQQLDKAKNFINENSNISFSFYGTNEILKLAQVYISHKKNDYKNAEQNFSEYKSMENPLSSNYLKIDFDASISKDFINEFCAVLKLYGFK